MQSEEEKRSADKPKPICGAKTRAGTPCKRTPQPWKKRCNLHGGKSLFGIASPRYKHGLYSQDITGIMFRAQIARQKDVDRFLMLWDEEMGRGPGGLYEASQRALARRRAERETMARRLKTRRERKEAREAAREAQEVAARTHEAETGDQAL